MIEFNDGHYRDLCRDGRVAAELSTLDERRRTALRQFWLRLGAGFVLAIGIGWSAAGQSWMGFGFFLAIVVFIVGIILAILPLSKAGEALKHPTLETLAKAGGLEYMPSGFDPPVYPDARKALFGTWLSGQTFTDLFHGTDQEGQRFAFYEAHLTRKSGKNTVTVFSGQIYAFQRRRSSGSEIVIVPDRGFFNFFKPIGGMERVRFEADAEFEKNFEVYAARPHEALSLIGSDVRRKLVELRAAGRVFAYVGPTDILVAASAGNKFEAGSMFRSTGGEERVRKMFEEVCESLTHLRSLKAGLD